MPTSERRAPTVGASRESEPVERSFSVRGLSRRPDAATAGALRLRAATTSAMKLISLVAAASIPFLARSSSRAEEMPRQDLAAIPVARSYNLVGVGAGLVPAFSGANESRAMVLPLLRVSYRDKLYWNVLQGGVWLWDSDDQSLRIGLAVEPRFGWRGEADTRVAGMQTRDFSVEGGPALQWRTPAGVLNASVSQDLGGASQGTTAQLLWIRALVSGGGLRLNGMVGAQWFSARMNQYYFSVTPIEATAGRPAYAASSSVSLQAGVNGAYRLSARGSFLFGAIATRLGDGAAHSPITETRLQGIVYVGYGWSF